MSNSVSTHVGLTGATGFAGRHIVAALLAAGHKVRALVRDAALAKLPDGVSLVVGDLADEAALQELVRGVDVVVHVAGAITALNRGAYFAANCDGAKLLGQVALAAGVGRFIHVSSLAAREPQISDYAASKRAGEEALDRLWLGQGLLILRPAAIYGPGDKATLPLLRELTRKIAVLPGRASNRFSLIHVADFARVVAAAVVSDVAGMRELDDRKSGGYDWNEVAAISRDVQGTPQRVVFLPRPLPEVVAIAAEMLAGLRKRASMINRGKIAEIYHGDWVAAGPGWPRDNAVNLTQGFLETFGWYRDIGWLPPLTGSRNNRIDP